MTKLYMHITTYEYLKRHPDMFKTSQQAMISQYSYGFNGIEIQIANHLSPTIDEPPKGTWMFPKERFVKYEASDEYWCRYCRIGREARGFIMGEILSIDDSFSIASRRGSTVFNPDRMGYRC